MKPAGIHTGRDDFSLVSTELPITAVLMIGFLTGAGDHEFGLGQGLFLGLNPAADGIGLIDLFSIATSGHQSSQLLPTQGVAGEDKGKTQSLTDQSTHKTGIGVVSMDPVDRPTWLREVLHQLVGQIFQMGPKQLLAEITLGSKWKSKNARARGNGLNRLAVGHIHPTVMDQTGDHVDLLNLGALSQAANQIEHIQRLATGIGITTELKITGPEQTVKMQMQQTNPQILSSKKLRSDMPMPQTVSKRIPGSESEKKVMDQSA